MMKKIAALSLFFFATSLFAEDWYVRPREGSYGNQDGTTYEHVWDGMDTSAGLNDNWDDVSPGDTVYICGFHEANLQRTRIRPTVSGTEHAPIIIDFRCSGIPQLDDEMHDTTAHPEIPYSSVATSHAGIGNSYDKANDHGWIIASASKQQPGDWAAPDVNGVYKSDNLSISQDWFITIRDGIQQEIASKPTTGPCGQWWQDTAGDNAIWWKPCYENVGGTEPLEVFRGEGGTEVMAFDGVDHFVVIEPKIWLASDRLVHITDAENITILRGDFRYSQQSLVDVAATTKQAVTGLKIYDTNIAWGQIGIDGQNSNVGSTAGGQNDWHIARNEIHHINIKPDGTELCQSTCDAHSIDWQGGGNVIIEDNHIHTGFSSCVLQYRRGQNSSARVTIRDNICEDMYVGNSSEGHGFYMTGDNCSSDEVQPEDVRSTIIENNIVRNAEGTALRLKGPGPDSFQTFTVRGNNFHGSGTLLQWRDQWWVDADDVNCSAADSEPPGWIMYDNVFEAEDSGTYFIRSRDDVNSPGVTNHSRWSMFNNVWVGPGTWRFPFTTEDDCTNAGGTWEAIGSGDPDEKQCSCTTLACFQRVSEREQGSIHIP